MNDKLYKFIQHNTQLNLHREPGQQIASLIQATFQVEAVALFDADLHKVCRAGDWLADIENLVRTTYLFETVADDPETGLIRRALRTPLNELGFEMVEVSRGEEALLLVRAESFHVVLLDIQMPGNGGMKTLTRLRTVAPRMPILMLTVQDCEEQKVEALECGADDYITKPFSIRECIARIRSAVRRAQTPERTEDATVQVGEIQIQPTRRLVSKSGRPIHLTKKEYDILHYLMLHAGRVVTYGRLLSSVWGMEYRGEIDYLRTFVRQLRKKIEDDPSNPKYLLTDPYVGYRFVEYPLTDDAANSLTATTEPDSEYKQ